MIRLLVVISLVFAGVVAMDLLGGLPVNIAVEWPGGSMAPPLRVVALALLMFAVLAVIAWRLLRLVIGTPGSIRGFFRLRRRDRGFAALSRGMIAVGSGDARSARRQAEEADRLLPQEPLVLLLKAQAAQVDGETAAARAAFTRMLEREDTRLLGLRGLFIEATRAGELAASRHYAAEAEKLSPGLAWASGAVIEAFVAERDFAGALATLERGVGARRIGKPEAARLRTVLLTARALDCEDREPEKARDLALEAHRLSPGFVPAAVAAARLLTRLGDARKASKTIETTWRDTPHPELADAYVHVRPGDSTRDRLKRARSLDQLRPGRLEGALAVARAALDAHEFGEARSMLARALREAPTQRVCLMMADLEEQEHGDRGRVREWLSRAVRAPRDATWTADGVTSDVWLPVSPVTGRLDAFEWRVPVASDSGVVELDGSDLSEQAVLPLQAVATDGPAVAPERSMDTVPDRAPEPVVEQPVPSAVPPRSAAPAAPARPAAEPQAIREPQPFLPDDPGIGGEVDEAPRGPHWR